MSEEPRGWPGLYLLTRYGKCLERDPKEKNQHLERMLQRGRGKDRKRRRFLAKSQANNGILESALTW